MTSPLSLTELFLHLAGVEGVSLAERRIADTVIAVLRDADVRVVEDGSAAILGGTAGNLLCFPPDFRAGSPAIMLTAHLDTVESTAALRPVVDATTIRSDGSTILGADNRMGLAVLVETLRAVVREKIAHRNFFVVFTVGEETGLFGAGTVDVSPFAPTGAYVFDCSKRPGYYIRECVGLHTFTADFIGKAAHAGVAPEEGVSAIRMACAAISKLRLGRVDPDTTANVGRIRGGEALNAIPAHATIEGEVRSYLVDRIKDELQIIEQTLQTSAGGLGRVEFRSREEFVPFTLQAGSPLLVHLEHAMRSVGLTPKGIRYTGGSDANKYNAKGFPAVNIGIGAQKPHSHEEFLLIDDLMNSSALALALVREEA